MIKLILLFFLCAATVVNAETPFRLIAADYLDFAQRQDGLISPRKINELGLENYFLINVNSASQYGKGFNIPGSINMDWREVLERANEIPKHKEVVVYCNTMFYSSKAQLLLNMDGYSNVSLMAGGYIGWRKYQRGLEQSNNR